MSPTRVFISHESALEFWRTHDLSRAGGVRRTNLTSLRGATAVIASIKPLVRQASPDAGRVYGARTYGNLASSFAHLDITASPLHVMVHEEKDRRKRANLTSHLYKQNLPSGSFCKIGDNVYVSSPELTLVQLAMSRHPVEMLELCLEFCGGYALAPDSEEGFIERPALTSANRLRDFVDKLKGRHGARLIRPVLKYVIDDSASPMETIVLMLLCLPSRMGGYQLPLPRHNVPLPINQRARSHTSRKRLVCDLYWKEFHLDVECDSTRYHTSKDQLGIDSDRRIILAAMNYQYVGVTWWQLEERGRFLDVVQAIRRAMGYKLRKAPTHVENNRERLRSYLITPQDKRGKLLLEKTYNRGRQRPAVP